MPTPEEILILIIVGNVALMIAAVRQIQQAYIKCLITPAHRATLLFFAVIVPPFGFLLSIRALNTKV